MSEKVKKKIIFSADDLANLMLQDLQKRFGWNNFDNVYIVWNVNNDNAMENSLSLSVDISQ